MIYREIIMTCETPFFYKYNFKGNIKSSDFLSFLELIINLDKISLNMYFKLKEDIEQHQLIYSEVKLNS
jgi:hypothetical protein